MVLSGLTDMEDEMRKVAHSFQTESLKIRLLK